MQDNTLVPADFEPVARDGAPAGDAAARPSLRLGKEALQALLRDRVATGAVIILLLLVAGALFLPLLFPFDYATQYTSFSNRPFFSVNPASGYLHIFGTDQLGRDIFVRLWYGARISLMVAGVVALIDCFVGVVYGSISGYLGGMVDTIMMRLLEIVSGVPYLVVVLLLMAVLPQGIATLIIAYSLVGWTGMARLVRGQAVALSGREFIIAAKISGAGMARIILRHLVPNMLGVIIVNVTLDIPAVIFTEAFLSMLGMGIPAPYPSLGAMVNEGAAVFQVYPARLAVSALLICLTMLACNLLGDRLQDQLNPKRRARLRQKR